MSLKPNASPCFAVVYIFSENTGGTNVWAAMFLFCLIPTYESLSGFMTVHLQPLKSGYRIKHAVLPGSKVSRTEEFHCNLEGDCNSCVVPIKPSVDLMIQGNISNPTLNGT